MTATDRSRGVGITRGIALSRSVLLGIALLVVLTAAGYVLVPGFASYTNIRSMLLLAAFLGLASLGQTLCALLGSIDMSIPFRNRFSQHPVGQLIQLGCAAGFCLFDRAHRRNHHWSY